MKQAATWAWENTCRGKVEKKEIERELNKQAKIWGVEFPEQFVEFMSTYGGMFAADVAIEQVLLPRSLLQGRNS